MKDKVEAIMELREVAEEHGRAVEALANDGTQAARDTLLAVRERLEEATVDAIESCHQCGLEHSTADHPADHPPATVTDIATRFRPPQHPN